MANFTHPQNTWHFQSITHKSERMVSNQETQIKYSKLNINPVVTITTVSKGPNNKARGNAYAEESGVEGVSGPVSVAKSWRAVETGPHVEQGCRAPSKTWTSGPVPALWGPAPSTEGPPVLKTWIMFLSLFLFLTEAKN